MRCAHTHFVPDSPVEPFEGCEGEVLPGTKYCSLHTTKEGALALLEAAETELARERESKRGWLKTLRERHHNQMEELGNSWEKVVDLREGERNEALDRLRVAMDMLRRIEWVQNEHGAGPWGWECPKCRKYESSWKEVEERTHKPDCELDALLHPEEQVDCDTPALRLLSDMASRECESPGQCMDTLPPCLSCRARDVIDTRRAHEEGA